MTTRARLALACLCAAPGLALGPGCDQPTGRRTTARAEYGAEPAPSAPAPPAEPAAPTPILGKRTTEIRDAQAETKSGGAVAVTPKITAKDPITLTGNAYVTAIGQTSIGNIKHAVDLYQADTGEFPKTYEEFMEKIIRANNIALPKLPRYQEYGYDAPTHSLKILEYPDRKAAMNYPR